MKPEVAAPGARIISTGGENRWYSSSGTSDATVFVTGALALILEAQPMLKPQPNGDASCLIAVKEALIESMQTDTIVHDERSGYGVLNAQSWLEHTSQITSC